jgi:hypothetical protein
MPRPLDLVGQRFYRLMVLERVANDQHGKAHFRCLCDCGVTIIACGSLLRRGTTKSCGCLARERLRSGIPTHGLSASPEYAIWQTMKARCANPNNQHFARYGGRGITVCSQWLHSFETFLADMGARPVGLTLERKDTNGPYSPDNCRWASWAEQFRNKRNNHFVTYEGTQVTLSDLSRLSGLGLSTIRYRLAHGIPLESAPRTGKNAKPGL